MASNRARFVGWRCLDESHGGRGVPFPCPNHVPGAPPDLAAVADYLAVPVEVVKRLALDGELRVLRIGSDRRVRPEDLQAFLRAAEE
ncbi:MAG: helix-turn-helix domain-containing protein [Myxococcaceae bacterium]